MRDERTPFSKGLALKVWIGPGKPRLTNFGKKTAVINMRLRQNDGINRVRRNRERSSRSDLDRWNRPQSAGIRERCVSISQHGPAAPWKRRAGEAQNGIRIAIVSHFVLI